MRMLLYFISFYEMHIDIETSSCVQFVLHTISLNDIRCVITSRDEIPFPCGVVQKLWFLGKLMLLLKCCSHFNVVKILVVFRILVFVLNSHLCTCNVDQKQVD